MSALPSFVFDYKKCISELDEYKTFLDSNEELKEQTQILPFFKDHPQLSAFIASLFSDFITFDGVKHEHTIYQNFICDLAVSDNIRQKYCFIEFEEAKKDSLFNSSSDWSSRLEHGYSQIIDWFWRLDEMKSTGDYFRNYGASADYYGLLVIGRKKFLDDTNTVRLKWRADHSVVDSKKILILTFDDLYEALKDKLEPYRLLP